MEMKRYAVAVVMSYWQHFEIEAASEEEAKATALDMWDENKPMYQGEGEVMECEELKGESK